MPDTTTPDPFDAVRRDALRLWKLRVAKDPVGEAIEACQDDRDPETVATVVGMTWGEVLVQTGWTLDDLIERVWGRVEILARRLDGDGAARLRKDVQAAIASLRDDDGLEPGE